MKINPINSDSGELLVPYEEDTTHQQAFLIMLQTMEAEASGLVLLGGAAEQHVSENFS
jgi:hypothetical protein